MKIIAPHKKTISILLATFFVATVSAAGIQSFLSIQDKVTVTQKPINISFDSSGLNWRQNTGEEVDLKQRKSFRYRFEDPLKWYSLNVSVEINPDNQTRIENITSYTFEAFNSQNTTLDSCSSLVNSTDRVYCDQEVSTGQEVQGFNISIDSDVFSQLLIEKSSKITLEAE